MVEYDVRQCRFAQLDGSEEIDQKATFSENLVSVF
jgi:hypothetical protein